MTASPALYHACRPCFFGIFPIWCWYYPPLDPENISHAIIEKILEANVQSVWQKTFVYIWSWSRMHVVVSVADYNCLPLQYCTPCFLLKFITGFKTIWIHGKNVWCLRAELQQRLLSREQHRRLGWDGAWPLLWYYHFDMRCEILRSEGLSILVPERAQLLPTQTYHPHTDILLQS